MLIIASAASLSTFQAIILEHLLSQETLEGFTPQPATPLGRPPCRARYPGILGFLTPGSSSRDLLGSRRLITIIYELHKYEQIFWYENHSNWLLLQLCMRGPDIKTVVCGVIVEWPTEGCGRLRGESFYLS